MDKLIELLQQIQDLAGVAIDALQGAMSDSGEAPAEGAPPGPPPGAPEGGTPAAG